MVHRIFVEKKPGFDVKARQLCTELRTILGIGGLGSLRLVNRYDVEGISRELFDDCVHTVFSEPQSDIATESLDQGDAVAVFGVEYLPGQFDQRAESAGECIQLISQGERPQVRSAQVYLLYGDLTDGDVTAIKHYLINPIEAREASLEERATLAMAYAQPAPVEVLEGFDGLDDRELSGFLTDRGLAMDLADLRFCQEYFREEGRPPTITEIKMIDTYWSDHCRHTTFGTQLEDIRIDDDLVQSAFDRYLEMRRELGRDDKPVCFMDMATIGARYLKSKGILTGLDESEEVNACTVKVTCDVDGKPEDWLFLFKNETHNHPTEIEPFGGAATCVGGAIRDPLSGRSYVYQAMRLTGAADPLVPVDETIPGKLPQRKIVISAAEGYSSYGNQIGLATGQVAELYHPGYVAKRMEIGAVLGATPADHVRREEPTAGDRIVLLGGRTGRDGIGGATGSSKAHTLGSLESCGAEVQKGNPPVERKIQRLFRRGDACRMIKRCNDFGAGGVSVAIGELADGLFIDLDRVPTKYEGLDGTELAISESQERMAVALAEEDVDAFIALAHEENLEATVVARVTDDSRLRMVWHGDVIVDVGRDFLSSNGAPKHMDVHVLAGGTYRPAWEGADLHERMTALLSDLNVCSRKGLSERFDSTIGAGTVLMPFGGVHQLTPPMAMVAKLPVLGEATTCSGMSWGFNPYLASADQYQGAYLAVVESITKLVSAGFRHEDAYLTFQEYFEKLGSDPERWGKPMASLLGALSAQVDLGVGSIGGKDSMSGSFEQLDVPPTLVSFAVACGPQGRITSPEFKHAGSSVLFVQPSYEGLLPEPGSMVETLSFIERLVADGMVDAVATPGYGGLAETLFLMCVGNTKGLVFDASLDLDLFAPAYGGFVLEVDADKLSAVEESVPAGVETTLLGITSDGYRWILADDTLELGELQEVWEARLEPLMPYRGAGEKVDTVTSVGMPTARRASPRLARPRVIIPVFPGNNCEYDSARAFERAGAEVDTFVINNLDAASVAESCDELCRRISRSQIVMIPGGFSGGDEPDGSAKFITAFFRAPQVTEAVRDLLFNRDGLMLGICNGFQALVKLGLVPFGDIRDMDAACPTLTFNSIGRHQSRLVRTCVCSDLSPWFSACEVGDVFTVPISHGEGRFVADDALLAEMRAKGQVATQYVGLDGEPSMDLACNPNGSVLSIEGITSPDGRILGKMGHSERSGDGLYVNVPGRLYQPIFEGGVGYFTD